MYLRTSEEQHVLYKYTGLALTEGSPTTLKSRTPSMKSVKKSIEIFRNTEIGNLVEVVLEPYIYVFLHKLRLFPSNGQSCARSCTVSKAMRTWPFTDETKILLSRLIHTRHHQFFIRMANVIKQSGTNDCGVFVIAYITHIALAKTLSYVYLLKIK